MEDNIIEMQTPLNPSKPERQWIRQSYNWGGTVMLIQFVIINIVAIITMFFAVIIVGIQSGASVEVIKKFTESITTEMGFVVIFSNIIGALVSYPIAFFIGCKGLKVKAKSFFSTKGYDAKFVIIAVIAALCAQLVGSYLAEFITWLFGQGGILLKTPDFSVKNDMATNILTYLLACIIAPIFEEMIFRGIVLKSFSKVSIRFGIFASALLFGIYHQNVPQGINAFVVGLVFAYVAYKTGSIIPTIIMHFAMNLNVMIQEAIVYYLEDYSETILSVWSITLAIITIIFAVIVIKNRKEYCIKKDSRDIKNRTFPIFITSWSVWTITFICVTTAIVTYTQLK